MLDDRLLETARAGRARVIELQHELDRARIDYHDAIRRLHAAGGSFREIADNLGLSHQRVHQIVDAGHGDGRDYEPTLRRQLGRRRNRGGREGRLGRFTDRARSVVALAEEEARDLRHDYVGTEHILLGLLRAEDELAAQALAELGVRYGEQRAAVEELVGCGLEDPPLGRLPFTPRSKKVLELALREALALEHGYVGTEHLLLGLVGDADGVATKILAEAGAYAPKIRSTVTRRLAA